MYLKIQESVHSALTSSCVRVRKVKQIATEWGTDGCCQGREAQENRKYCDKMRKERKKLEESDENMTGKQPINVCGRKLVEQDSYR